MRRMRSGPGYAELPPRCFLLFGKTMMLAGLAECGGDSNPCSSAKIPLNLPACPSTCTMYLGVLMTDSTVGIGDGQRKVRILR